MDSAVVAILIFVLTYIAIASEKVNRTVVAFTGALLLLLFNIFDLNQAIGFINWETIGLLFGMFLIVTALSDSGFFNFLALRAAKKLKYSPKKIFIFFPILAGLLSAFIDSITVILFFAVLTYELCKMIKIDPAPLVITEVIMANIGGSATLVGDPPNVILGLKLGFYFNDFVIHNGPISVVAGAATLLFCYLVSRKALIPHGKISIAELEQMDPREAIEDTRQLKVSLGAFFGAILLLITHSYLEKYLNINLSVALAAMIPAFIMLLILGKTSERIIEKVDFDVILFFMGLFVVVGGLEATGVIERLSAGLTEAFRGNDLGLITTLLWGSGLVSGVVDNVPLALSMAYVLENMVKFAGVPALSIMVWAVSLGADIGGNLTPIGASSNVIAYASMEKRGYSIGWGRWLKLALPATIIAVTISNIGIYLKFITGFY
ncbi:MAG: SLC13 family permease [Actinomycetota bacterium]